MSHSPLPCRLLRAGALFLLSCWAGAAAAQSIEPTDVEGTRLSLVIPAGYCKLARDTEPGRSFYGSQERMQSGMNLVVMIYVDCNELAKVKSGKAKALPHYGMVLAPNAGGHVNKLPPGVSRAQGIDEVAKSVPMLDTATMEKATSARAKGEGVALDKMVTGLLGKDANALYVGAAANVGSPGAGTRVQGVTLITFLKGIGISDARYSPDARGAPFSELLAAQKLQAAALIKAN